MKMSNKNKFISGLLSVAMCPMMLPTAAFAADDGTASEVSSSPTELIQSSELEGTDTGASSGDTLAEQFKSMGEAPNATTSEAANDEAAPSAVTGREDTTASVAEVNGTTYSSLQEAINVASRNATVKLLADTKENVTISTPYVTLDLNGHTLNGGTGTAKAAILNKGNVTITDTSADKTGTIKRDDQGIEGETSYYVIDNNGTMVIDQANVVNNSGIKGSSLIRNGGVDTVS